IFCAALIHRYVLPARVSGQFNTKLSQTLQAARGRVADTLAGKPDAASGPLHLALALQFLQGISHHIPYDFALSAPVRQARKAIHDRLARLVIVNCELRDRLPAIETLPADVLALLGDVQAWLAAEGADASSTADALRLRCALLIDRYAAQAQTFDDALQVSFIRYLSE
ncbi:FUSC family protein, partial [Enterobacter hormaechei]|uniref:FUSC family protein n=2 Tax=Enterobacteriaceae TaxID=543 RepID=UPI0035240C86